MRLANSTSPAVTPQRGWEAFKAIGSSDPEATSEEPQMGHARRSSSIKELPRMPWPRRRRRTPGKPIEVFTTDEHRIGLKTMTSAHLARA